MEKKLKKSEKTKLKLFSSGMTLLNDLGYDNLTVQDITDHSRVAKGTFYTYFKSLEDFIMYSFQEIDNIYLDVYQDCKDMSDFHRSLESFLTRSYLEIEKYGRELIRASIIIQLKNNLTDYSFNKDRHLARCLRDFHETAKKEGSLKRDMSFDDFFQTIICFMIATEYEWCLVSKDLSLSQLAERNFKTLTSGLAK